MAVGVLLGGLVAGWLRSVSRRFGRIPEPALWMFDSVGLNVFMALVGISAGPDFVRGLQESGLRAGRWRGVIVAASRCIATMLRRPLCAPDAPGRAARRVRGRGHVRAGSAAVQDVATSKIPTLGYGVSYAVGNVLLALWGTVIVALVG